MEAALSLPELLIRLFPFLTDGALYSASLANRQWNLLATEELWGSRMVSMHALIGLLGPLDESGKDSDGRWMYEVLFLSWIEARHLTLYAQL